MPRSTSSRGARNRSVVTSWFSPFCLTHATFFAHVQISLFKHKFASRIENNGEYQGNISVESQTNVCSNVSRVNFLLKALTYKSTVISVCLRKMLHQNNIMSQWKCKIINNPVVGEGLNMYTKRCVLTNDKFRMFIFKN